MRLFPIARVLFVVTAFWIFSSPARAGQPGPTITATSSPSATPTPSPTETDTPTPTPQCTEVGAPLYLSPDGEVNLPLQVELSWYSVCQSTNTIFLDSHFPPTSIVCSGVYSNCQVQLEPNTTYYWMAVIENTANCGGCFDGQAGSAVAQFRTGDAPTPSPSPTVGCTPSVQQIQLAQPGPNAINVPIDIQPVWNSPCQGTFNVYLETVLPVQAVACAGVNGAPGSCTFNLLSDTTYYWAVDFASITSCNDACVFGENSQLGTFHTAVVPAPPGWGVADFNNSGCTDLIDFLYMLDNWQAILGGQQVDIIDFLALLDNWRTGAACV